jgi:hypothetical protein
MVRTFLVMSLSNAEWYRSDRSTPPADLFRPSVGRTVRNWLRSRLAEPDVAGKTIVLYARQGFSKMSAWAGLFSEFHSVVGALSYAEAHGAAGVRVDFRSDLYVDAQHGPNWWTYFFERDLMCIGGRSSSGEVHLDRSLAKYGRHGGFCDVVNGNTPYLYPMTYGVSRPDVHRLVALHIHVRPPILDEVARAIAASTEPGAYVVAVHYRGTDSTRRSGLLTDNQTRRVSYQAYADEVRRALESAAPRSYQVFVASDEVECVEFMRQAFGDRVIYSDAPRVHADDLPIHLDRTLPVSNYQKGKSGLVDCLRLAAADYLVKGRSNLSDASLAFNPRLPYSFCLR